ncbi:MAG: IGHMBP2 family helicase [Aquificae bacterium]|nr:IGHMBP2 family helicase [Aquificota bacterium]
MSELNEYQKRAIERAIKSDKFFLIHGPPGTGKTTTLTECIATLAKQGKKILATADSNVAVDNLVERLTKKGIKAVRVGNPVRVLESIRKHTLDHLLEHEPEFQKAKKIYEEIEKLKEEQSRYVKPEPRYRRGLSDEEILKHAKTGTPVRGLSPKLIRSMAKWIKLQHKINELYQKAKEEERKAIGKILSRAQVVCTTNSSAGSEVLEGMSFDVAVVDEATQAVEPSCLIPITKAKRVIMAGDHKQLPPTVLSQEAQEELSYTLFERLLELYGEDIYEMLRVQYRMNKKIMDFPSKKFYGGKLVAHPSVENITLRDIINPEKLKEVHKELLPILEPQNVVVFVDVKGEEKRRKDSPSYYNEEEAKLAKRIVEELLKLGLSPSDIGVISPYDEQVRLLEEKLKDKGVEIKTVDGFQGREKEVIVLSLVRSNPKKDIGFLKDYRRLNVAITRPKRKLIILGNADTLSGDEVYNELIEYVKKEGLFTGEIHKLKETKKGGGEDGR